MRPALLLLAIVLALHSTIHAAETHLSNGITVSDQFHGDVGPLFLDTNPNTLTREQFAGWAKKFNEKQLADAKVRHEQYLKERGPLQSMNLAGSSGNSRIQYGGGYGIGGMGGYGGYLGYDNHTGTNYNGATSQQGNVIITDRSESSYSYRHTYRDLNDAGGGPVMFINPHCYDYWCRSARVPATDITFPHLDEGPITPR